MMPRRRYVEFLALAPLLFLVQACGNSEAARIPDAPTPPDVSIVTVAPESVPVSSEWVATLDGTVNAQIRPQVSGYLVRTLYRDGSFVGGDQPYIDVYNPGDGSIISRVPMSTRDDVDAAVASAERAFPGWSRTPIKERVQVFYKYKALLEKHIDELAALVTEENGKVTSEARAEILKAAELCEFACSLPQMAPSVNTDTIDLVFAFLLPCWRLIVDWNCLARLTSTLAGRACKPV